MHSRNPGRRAARACAIGMDSWSPWRGASASPRRSPPCRRARSARRRCVRSTTSPRTRCWRTSAASSSRASSRASRIASGRVVYQRPPATPQQVMDPRVAFIMRDMMRDVAERGTRRAGATRGAGEHPGRGQDGHDERQRGRLVHGDDAGARGRRVARLRPAEDDHARRGRRLARRADLGRDDGALLRRSRRRPRRGPRRPACLPRSSIASPGLLADSLTPPAQRYTEYFFPGTEPEALKDIPWRGGGFGRLIGY